MPPPSRPPTRPAAPAAGRWPDVLDVHLTAQWLTVSADTVYALLQRGALPGRTVGPTTLSEKTLQNAWSTDTLLSRHHDPLLPDDALGDRAQYPGVVL